MSNKSLFERNICGILRVPRYIRPFDLMAHLRTRGFRHMEDYVLFRDTLVALHPEMLEAALGYWY